MAPALPPPEVLLELDELLELELELEEELEELLLRPEDELLDELLELLDELLEVEEELLELDELLEELEPSVLPVQALMAAASKHTERVFKRLVCAAIGVKRTGVKPEDVRILNTVSKITGLMRGCLWMEN
ncbi:MAG: hypothetical protein RL497_322 [Pseudomonadota bacterium]|jgi:tRNA U34 5-methylaminomethyl-2-thiouridine-forming methyltransferase MnmC